MRTFLDGNELSGIIHRLMDAAGGAVQVSAALDKRYSTLMAEVNGLYNPESHNKLGVETLLDILALAMRAGAVEAVMDTLRWFNERFGAMPPVRKPVREATGECLHQGMTRVQVALGKVGEELSAALAPDGPGGEAVLLGESLRIEARIGGVYAELAALNANRREVTVDTHPNGRRRGTGQG